MCNGIFTAERDDYTATASEASWQGWGLAARSGSVVRTTQMVSAIGSAQARVPVAPLWAKVFCEQWRLVAFGPRAKPRPRGVRPSALWFWIINRAVSGFTT